MDLVGKMHRRTEPLRQQTPVGVDPVGIIVNAEAQVGRIPRRVAEASRAGGEAGADTWSEINRYDLDRHLFEEVRHVQLVAVVEDHRAGRARQARLRRDIIAAGV